MGFSKLVGPGYRWRVWFPADSVWIGTFARQACSNRGHHLVQVAPGPGRVQPGGLGGGRALTTLSESDPAMTSGARPDFGDRTDLIAQAHAHDAMQSPAGPGKLRTYLGIAPGVGKTYAMLRDARARRRSGTDTVVAHWERHGRAGGRCSARRTRSAPCPRWSPTGAPALRIWTSLRLWTVARSWLWWTSCACEPAR